ncbi:hypothetical protein B9Z55_011643 [Caenorhabditis nigoni]|uniref:Uncharacterized protein n=1 Tax=Caenorhabditis nigoni TaxID=1611254 RepID=A0A2G5UKY0_9PELO|nr:hypothetical protein B9Z55_011643 [Caenorhabditis nigoni]
MGVPNGLVKKLLREPLKQIKEFDDYYAQEGEKLGLRIAQRLLERVRWHTSRPNRTEYLQQMDDLVDHLEVFSAQGLEDLRKFDESYAFYKEEIHLRNAIKALEKVRYGNLNRDQRNVHYREILDNLQEILDLPGPVEDYSELTLEETRNLMRSVGERSAEMDRLFEADKRNQIGLIGNVSNIFIWTKTAVIDTYEGIKTKIGMINFPFLS